LLQRCFAIIEAWGFRYKASFVWNKDAHVPGFYNSVRHEFLLICTRGSCTRDIDTMTPSVQTIKRSDKHSEKPRKFYDIIESMYDHGRKLELFSRGTAPEGWDTDGNESSQARATASIDAKEAA
jgi:N6-adenosine-specific RNA methylase IME4